MEFFLLALAGFGGILLHILMKFRDAITKEPKQGRPMKERLGIVWRKFDFLGNLVYALFALVLVVICVALREQLKDIFPITATTILAVGYAADSALKNIMPEK